MTRTQSTSSPAPTRTRRVQVGELTFDVLEAGPAEGRPVVLLHGFPQTAWSWRMVIPALVEAGYRVLAPDQRGYSTGARPDGVEPYAGEHLVADVLGILDALGIGAADVVGHDWGAAVGWQLAGLHPERVTTLTAISVPHPGAFLEALSQDPQQREMSLYMRDFASPGYEHTLLADDAEGLRTVLGNGRIAGVDVEHVLQRLGSPEVLRRTLNWYAAQSRERSRSVPHVEVPTLHIWSDRDAALGEYGARATERYVSGPYRFEVLTRTTHWVPEQAAARTAELVLEHLSAHPAGGPGAAPRG